jgi:hypothetical protein
MCPFWACGPEGKGNPREACLVFIGINPSSPIDPHYWDGMTFDYLAFRSDPDRKPGKTRRRIFEIVSAVEEALEKPLTFVNTNIYWKVSKRLKGLKNPGVPNLPSLLDLLPPKALLVTHGLRAQRIYQKLDLPSAIHCPVHLSGLGAKKGVKVKDSFDQLTQQIIQCLMRR